jgi:predicted ATPase
VQVAVEVLPAFPDGVWFVELAPLSDSALVAQTVANVLGVREAPGQALLMVLNHYLHDKTLLLVLDNCEHLVEGCAWLTEALLHAGSNLRILATSRETLNIAGEIVYPVPSLSTPDPDHLPPVEALMQYEAVRLFIERASAAWPGFVLMEANALAIAKICHHLDGIPLALELAAARLKMLNVEQIAARLANVFHLLAEGSRTALPRHQTLRATIDWSYDLLSDSERTLLRRLSVFAGGWTLEAAERVTNDEVASEGNHSTDPPALAAAEVLDLLSQLVNKSLVFVQHQPGSQVRYAMLETIRAYALEKLSAAGETARLCARHFDFFYDLAQQAEPKLFISPEVNEISRIETEIDNLRAALAWALEPNIPQALQEERAERGLELMTYVWPLWLYRGYASQGGEWLDRLLAAHTALTPARVRAFLLATDFARNRGDVAQETLLTHQVLAMSRELGDKQRIAWSLMEVGLTERGQAHYSRAIACLSESIALFQELGDSLWAYRTSLRLAETHLMNGDLEAARPLSEAGLDWFHQQGDKWHMAWGLEHLGTIARLEGQLERAAALYTESLKLRVEVLDKLGVAISLQGFAQLAAVQQQAERAAVLWSAADQLRQNLELRLMPSHMILYTSLISKVRAQLGDEAFAAAWAKGQGLSLAQAVEYAFADEPPAQGS